MSTAILRHACAFVSQADRSVPQHSKALGQATIRDSLSTYLQHGHIIERLRAPLRNLEASTDQNGEFLLFKHHDDTPFSGVHLHFDTLTDQLYTATEMHALMIDFLANAQRRAWMIIDPSTERCLGLLLFERSSGHPEEPQTITIHHCLVARIALRWWYHELLLLQLTGYADVHHTTIELAGHCRVSRIPLIATAIAVLGFMYHEDRLLRPHGFLVLGSPRIMSQMVQQLADTLHKQFRLMQAFQSHSPSAAPTPDGQK